MAFQYPVEIPGVNNAYFLKAALNAKRKEQGLEELDAIDFMTLVKEEARRLQMDETACSSAPSTRGSRAARRSATRSSTWRCCEPTLAVLDETDSGLDIDALRIVADGVNALRSPERAFIVVTHYQRLLDYIVPDFVHVLSEGRIVQSGGRELALELEAKGYVWLEGAAGAGAQPMSSTVAERHDWVLRGQQAARHAGAPEWLAAHPRRARCERFECRLGFPTTRLEDWRFTNIAPDRRDRLRAGAARGRRRRAHRDRRARAARRAPPPRSVVNGCFDARCRRCGAAAGRRRRRGWPAASSDADSTRRHGRRASTLRTRACRLPRSTPPSSRTASTW